MGRWSNEEGRQQRSGAGLCSPGKWSNRTGLTADSQYALQLANLRLHHDPGSGFHRCLLKFVFLWKVVERYRTLPAPVQRAMFRPWSVEVGSFRLSVSAGCSVGKWSVTTGLTADAQCTEGVQPAGGPIEQGR